MISRAPKVLVGTLTWNQKKDTLECLDSVSKLDYPNYEVAVVDNGSSDGTAEAVRRAYPEVKIVRHSENLGCAEGVNGEIRAAFFARADYLFIIANDATAAPDCLTELVRVAESDPAIGVVFPKVYRFDEPEKVWFAKGARVRDIDWFRGQFKGFIQNVADDASLDVECDTELYPGGFCLVRMQAVKRAGFLEPGYFIYYDDADWLMRIHRAGFKGRYAPRAKAWHKPSSSIGLETPGFYYYRTRNRLMFFERFSDPLIFAVFFLYFLYEFFLRTVPGFYRTGKPALAQACLWGFFDYLRKKTGMRTFQKSPQGPEENDVNTQPGGGRGADLVVNVQWNIGDEIMMIPAYEALKRKFPQARLQALVRYPELLQNNPFVDQVNGPAGKAGRRIDLHREERGTPRMETARRASGCADWGRPKIYLAPEEVAEARRKWDLGGEDCLIALSGSAKWISRKWEKSNWEALTDHFKRHYRAKLLILGKDDEPVAGAIDLVGKTSLRETAAILSLCRLFVGTDSGPVHLALAVGTPAVALYGPLDPSYLVEARPGFYPVWTDLECRGCWSYGRMPYPDHCPKIDADCLRSISVERVREVCDKVLNEEAVLNG
ncbi:MAG: glycosyltransferase [Candidatus Omnitrophica bacterium]|nr:glycosyltransferase [Candidatus Omnitrophota bacterium]